MTTPDGLDPDIIREAEDQDTVIPDYEARGIPVIDDAEPDDLGVDEEADHEHVGGEV